MSTLFNFDLILLFAFCGEESGDEIGVLLPFVFRSFLFFAYIFSLSALTVCEHARQQNLWLGLVGKKGVEHLPQFLLDILKRY
jgi:hypothetical protein